MENLEKYIVNGGRRLHGEVKIGGAKNAAVAIIPAVILADSPCIIENVPNISDVTLIANILQGLGASVRNIDKSTLEIDPTTIFTHIADYEQVKGMRASYYLLGALLGRYGRAEVAMPGGCNFGVRPIDLHIKAFEALGANHTLRNGVISVCADKLIGSKIYLDVVSVGATINAMLASVKADGYTEIENAAKEPHIVDLANFLNSMGANIKGAGTDTIKIRGVESLHGTTYSIIPDQIEAGTYMVAVAATGGDVVVSNVIPKHLEVISAKLCEMGVVIEEYDEAVRVTSDGRLKKCIIKTMPYPGFPTDMQPQFAALLTTADGISIVNENVWENRFQYVPELARLGAKISVEGKSAFIEGVDHLEAAPVKATDLRAGAAMLIAALSTKGTTEIENICYIERGYENIVEKLQSLGADITKSKILKIGAVIA